MPIWAAIQTALTTWGAADVGADLGGTFMAAQQDSSGIRGGTATGTASGGMPERSSSGGRSVPTSGGVSRGASGGTLSDSPYVPPAPPPSLTSVFPAQGRAGASPFIGGPGTSWLGNVIPDITGDGEIDSTNSSDSPRPLYGTDSPFAILADLFARGGGPGAEGEEATGNQFFPVGGGSGGSSNVAIIFILLAVVGAAYYFFIYKKKGGASAS